MLQLCRPLANFTRIHWIGLRSGMDAVGKRAISYAVGNRRPVPLSGSPNLTPLGAYLQIRKNAICRGLVSLSICDLHSEPSSLIRFLLCIVGEAFTKDCFGNSDHRPYRSIHPSLFVVINVLLIVCTFFQQILLDSTEQKVSIITCMDDYRRGLDW
jgi:hypothetical protein